MHRHLASLCALFLSLGAGQSAIAADVGMPLKAPPAPLLFNWSGIYVGGNLGLGFGQAAYTNVANTTAFGDAVAGTTFGQSAMGVTGGGQIGLNWQMSNLVFGAELAGIGSGIKASSTSTFGAADDMFDTNVDWLVLATGRIGFAISNLLPYIKGGYAAAGVRSSVIDNVGITGSGTASATLSGYTVGGGVELAVSRNISAALEYDYVSLGGGRFELSGVGPGVYTWDVNIRPIHLLSGRLNYRF